MSKKTFEIMKTESKLCLCCMEKHDVETVKVREKGVFQNKELVYDAIYEYCSVTDEFLADEDMIRQNDIMLKDAMRESQGILSSSAIENIRKKYNISQMDLALVLGWGAKTITRYETYQIPDRAHNDILVKIDSDPEWFMVLLERSRVDMKEKRYLKYYEAAKEQYMKTTNEYIRKSLLSLYAGEELSTEEKGNQELNTEKLVEMINYIAAGEVTVLYLVKLMKMLWYSDALHYKRHGKSISGMVYKALPMGAVPIGYHQILELQGICYEEQEFEESTGYLFKHNELLPVNLLTIEERNSLDTVIARFSKTGKREIVDTMHREDAYLQTKLNKVISFKYADTLSLN